MKTTFVEIRDPSRRRRVKRALGDQFVLGRGARADVPLPFAKDLEPHHLLCVPGEAGIWLSVAEGARCALESPSGERFRRGTVPWGATLKLGALELAFHVRRPPSPGAGRIGRLALTATAIAAAAVVWQLLARAEASPLEPGIPPPELFADPGPCRLEPVMALGGARESAEAGHARAERYAYHVTDGIAAVAYFVTASRCFEIGGDQAEAARMKGEADALRKRIDNDYRLSHVKLEKALRAEDVRDGLTHARALLGFTEGIPGEYRDWLIDVERVCAEKIAAEQARKKPRPPWLPK